MSRKPLAILVILSLAVAAAYADVDASADPGTDSGADYLESVMRRIQIDKYITSGEDLNEDYRPTPVPHHHHSNIGGSPHGPPLSKGELLALYQAAVAKGSGLNLSALPSLPLTGEQSEHHEDFVNPSDQGTLPGYYYYFYPIKSFLPNTSSDLHGLVANGSGHDMMMTMVDDNAMSEDNKETRIDPLFLAMAGFVSVATIVSFSILFLPKFGDDRSWQKAALKNLPEADEEDDMFSLTKVVGQAIQGKDCADRLACELGRAIRTMKLGQKPIRVLEAMLPPYLSKQMSQIRQHMVRREKCKLIPCNRFKPLNKPKPNNKKQPKPQSH